MVLKFFSTLLEVIYCCDPALWRYEKGTGHLGLLSVLQTTYSLFLTLEGEIICDTGGFFCLIARDWSKLYRVFRAYGFPHCEINWLLLILSPLWASLFLLYDRLARRVVPQSSKIPHIYCCCKEQRVHELYHWPITEENAWCTWISHPCVLLSAVRGKDWVRS